MSFPTAIQEHQTLLSNLKGMLDLRYSLTGLSAHCADPTVNPTDYQGWEQLHQIDRAEIGTLRQAINFVEQNEPKPLITLHAPGHTFSGDEIHKLTDGLLTKEQQKLIGG